HDERGLHRHGGAVAGIDALDLARDQPVGHIAEPGAPVRFRYGRPEQAERTHVGDDGAIEALLAIVHKYAREQLVLGIAAGAITRPALFLGELAFEVERILPVERGVLALRHRAMAARLGGLGHRMLRAWAAPTRSPRELHLPGSRPAAAGNAQAFHAHVHPQNSRARGPALPPRKRSANDVRSAPVAQPDRSLPSEGRGNRFESCRARHEKPTKSRTVRTNRIG